MAAHPRSLPVQPTTVPLDDSGNASRYSLVAPEPMSSSGGRTRLTLIVDETPAPSRAVSLVDERPHCPVCDGPGTRIVYGELRGALEQAARIGRIVRGGSVPRAATHRCPRAHEWDAEGPRHAG